MKEDSWRNFQSEYIKKRKKKDFFLKTVKSITGLLILFFLTTGLYLFNSQVPENEDALDKPPVKNKTVLPQKSIEKKKQPVKKPVKHHHQQYTI